MSESKQPLTLEQAAKIIAEEAAFAKTDDREVVTRSGDKGE